MGLTYIVIALSVLLIVSVIYEPRSFRNAILLLTDMGFLFLSMMMDERFALPVILILLLVPVVFYGSSLYLMINGVIILRREGFSFANALALGLGLFMFIGSIASFILLIVLQEQSLLRSLLYLVIVIECYLAFSFAALFIYAGIYTGFPKRLKCDYIIIHGCGLSDGERITPLLRARIDKAVEIYRKCGGTPVLILSGGQGPDEKISEARAMKNYLEENFFDTSRLILEERSATTFENLKYARELTEVEGKKSRYIFVTNNYHVFRTGLYARKLKMNAQGVGCRTAGYYWPSAFIREYIAVMADSKWVFGVIVLLWGIVELMLL